MNVFGCSRVLVFSCEAGNYSTMACQFRRDVPGVHRAALIGGDQHPIGRHLNIRNRNYAVLSLRYKDRSTVQLVRSILVADEPGCTAMSDREQVVARDFQFTAAARIPKIAA